MKRTSVNTRKIMADFILKHKKDITVVFLDSNKLIHSFSHIHCYDFVFINKNSVLLAYLLTFQQINELNICVQLTVCTKTLAM